MTAPTDCVIHRVRKIACGDAAVDAAFLGDNAVFILGEQSLLFVDPEGLQADVAPHDGAILSSARWGGRLMTGGDDGRVCIVDAARDVTLVHHDPSGRWIDCVALGTGGSAWSAGRQAFFKPADGEDVACLDLPSSIGGIGIAPDGRCLAVAHYNGVTMWQPGGGPSELLEWKGAHLGATFSPDGAYVVTRMREPALHGWRLSDRKDIPMQGYVSPVRSVSWTVGGKWLATSGSQYLMLWPFHLFAHPMGGVPILLCGYRAQSVAVAAHPVFDLVAVGYQDGLVLLVRIEDEAEILIKNPGSAPVRSIVWNETGNCLAVLCENGDGRVIDLAFSA